MTKNHFFNALSFAFQGRNPNFDPNVTKPYFDYLFKSFDEDSNGYIGN